MVDALASQLEAAADRAGLTGLFGPTEFDVTDVGDPGACSEGAAREVRFGNAEGPLGLLRVDLRDSGDPEDRGLTVGLRGWMLADDVASV